jgi:hypothetical protein
MNRRSVIQLLIGVIAAVGGLGALTVIRQNRCVDAGGQWSMTQRSCTGSSGPIPVERWSDVTIALVIGLLLAVMLYRASTFANRRQS